MIGLKGRFRLRTASSSLGSGMEASGMILGPSERHSWASLALLGWSLSVLQGSLSPWCPGNLGPWICMQPLFLSRQIWPNLLAGGLGKASTLSWAYSETYSLVLKPSTYLSPRRVDVQGPWGWWGDLGLLSWYGFGHTPGEGKRWESL